MKVTFIDKNILGEQAIAQCSSICYNSNPKDLDRISRLKEMKHLATFRFAYATILVEDISRACSHQLVRHPHLSYLQESQRYVNQEQCDYIVPDDVTREQVALMGSLYSQARLIYKQLISAGMKKEDARFVLPQGSTTRMYITGNLQAWCDFLEKRLDKHSQWEIRAVAEEIHKHFKQQFPKVFA